ncbi:MAG: bifunctional nuclease family protein [Phycisphaerales bacterium JB050]
MAVRMELSRILIADQHDLNVIELREIDGDRTFPILIGAMEAEAIRRRLQGVELKRPLTHELMMSIIDAFEGNLKEVRINDLNDHTFFALLIIHTDDGRIMEIDSRPSDAIALAVAADIPIFVEESVIEGATTDL